MYRTCQTCDRDFYAVEDWKKNCINCYIKSKDSQYVPPPRYQYENNDEDEINREMLKRIIYLCHPDKHDNSKTSLIVTKFLLAKKNCM